MAEPDPLELIGKQLLGRYTVRDKIASGGMSVVLRAQDERLQRPVCVKVFFGIDRDLPEYQTNYEHFVQEAFALSQLQHPHTIRIYDFGYLEQAPNSPFFVSELMTGGTLQALVRKAKRLSPAEALAILQPLVEALTEAHGHGIIHRDIKPSNILFGAAGTRQIVKLADFGIAKANLDDDERSIPNRAQDTRAAKGRRISLYSPGWAAPEQMRARPVGPTADVFSLGLLLAFMLTGKKVFSDEDILEALSKRMEGDRFLAKAMEELNLSPSITEVLCRACRADPTERYATAEAFLNAVRAAEQASLPPVLPEEEPTTDGLGSAVVPTQQVALQVTTLVSLAEEVKVAGRPLLLLPVAAPLDIGGDDDGAVNSPARLRLTFLPSTAIGPRLHLKGLNCFVVKPSARPSSAVEVLADVLLELRRPGVDHLDAVGVSVGKRLDATRWIHNVQNHALAIPLSLAPRSVLLDFGPGRALVLVYSIRS